MHPPANYMLSDPKTSSYVEFATVIREILA